MERTVPRTQVVSPYTPEGARQISESGRIAYGEVNFADRPDKEFQGAADKVKAEAEGREGLGSSHRARRELFGDQELPASEAIGLL